MGDWKDGEASRLLAFWDCFVRLFLWKYPSLLRPVAVPLLHVAIESVGVIVATILFLGQVHAAMR
jgi:hypothetical protein